MNETKDDGGPAFPYVWIENGTGIIREQIPGMSLRDYFAAKAMPQFIERLGKIDSEGNGFLSEHVAGWAYLIADAMLKARNQ